MIWIFGDQHRAQATGYAGDPNVITPNIDRLASDGMVFDRAVAGCPLCCPFRGSMLSGRYPHQAVPGHEMPLPDGMPTIAQPFQEAGYRTAYFGKWHVDGFRESGGRAALHTIAPNRRGGFETWVGYENNNAQWDCHVHGHDESGNEIPHYRLDGYETDGLTDLAIDYLRRRGADRAPFFSALSVQPPHNPYVAPSQWMGRHTPGTIRFRPNVPDVPSVRQRASRDLAGYYAMIENLDYNIGRIIDALTAAGLADDTHIIFFSDHGDMHGSQGLFHKTNPFEEAVRVPFIISGLSSPYHGRCGSTDAPINHVDIGPTTLGLCGLEVPSWMAGTNYAHHRIRTTMPHNEPDSAYLQLVVPTRHGHSIDRPWRGVVTRDGWKYVCLEHQPWLMFDLNNDPYEQVNLALNTAFGRQRRRLHERLAAWIKQTGDSFALPQDIA